MHLARFEHDRDKCIALLQLHLVRMGAAGICSVVAAVSFSHTDVVAKAHRQFHPTTQSQSFLLFHH